MLVDTLVVLSLAQSALGALLDSLVDVLVLLLLVIVVKTIKPLNRRATALWQRGLLGKILIVVIAFLATATTSGFVFGLMKWGAYDETLGVSIGSSHWWGIQLTALGFIASLFFLLVCIGGREKRRGP